jgi:hypothetical protein
MKRYSIQRFVNRAGEVDAKLTPDEQGDLVRYADYCSVVEFVFLELSTELCLCPDCIQKRETFKRRVLDGSVLDDPIS